MSKKPSLKPGSPVFVKIRGEVTPAAYQGWSDKYNLAVVTVGTQRLYRRLLDVVPSVPAAKDIPAEEAAEQPLPPAGIKCQRAYEPTYLRQGDVVEYKGMACRVVRASDCAAELAVPQPGREIITRDGRSGYIKGGIRIERISPNSEIPILNR